MSSADRDGEWLMKWLLGIITSVVLIGGAGWLSWIAVQLVETKKLTEENTVRIAVLESNQLNLVALLTEIKTDIREIKSTMVRH